MKTKFFLFILFLLVAVVGFFVFMNPTKVPLYITPSIKFVFPVSLIILGAVISGFFIMFIIALFREIKISFENRKLKKAVKNKEKSIELFEKGLKEKFLGNIKGAIKNVSNALKYDNNFIFNVFLQNFEKDFQKKEEIINKLPFELSKFFLIKHYFEHKKYGTIINLSQDLLKDSNFKNLELLEIIRDSYANIEKYKEAAEVQEKILSFKNIDKVSNVKKLAELRYLETKLEQSESNLNDLIKKFNTFRPAYFLKFQFLKKQDKILDAIRLLKDAYKNCNDYIFLCQLVKCAIESNDDKIKKDIEKFLSKIKSKEADILKALLLFHENSLDSAEEIVKKYLDNNFASIIYAEILYRKNMDIKDIIEIFRKVLNTQEGICLKFICKECKSINDKWNDFCPKCNSFDSLECSFFRGV